MSKNEQPIYCSKCSALLGHGHTYGYAFYCNECLPVNKPLTLSKTYAILEIKKLTITDN